MAFDRAFPKIKKEKQKELLTQMIEEDEKDDLYFDWDVTLNDGLEDIEVKEPEVVKSRKEFLSKLDEIETQITKNTVIEEQQEKINNLESELKLANEEINQLDRAAIQIVDSLKHLDDYLKHHGKAYSPLITDWNELKLGFAEEDDYIELRKLRSQPIGKNDPYLDKNIDPDYPKNKENDDIITY
jgi:hypothetical protein